MANTSVEQIFISKFVAAQTPLITPAQKTKYLDGLLPTDIKLEDVVEVDPADAFGLHMQGTISSDTRKFVARNQRWERSLLSEVLNQALRSAEATPVDYLSAADLYDDKWYCPDAVNAAHVVYVPYDTTLGQTTAAKRDYLVNVWFPSVLDADISTVESVFGNGFFSPLYVEKNEVVNTLLAGDQSGEPWIEGGFLIKGPLMIGHVVLVNASPIVFGATDYSKLPEDDTFDFQSVSMGELLDNKVR